MLFLTTNPLRLSSWRNLPYIDILFKYDLIFFNAFDYLEASFRSGQHAPAKALPPPGLVKSLANTTEVRCNAPRSPSTGSETDNSRRLESGAFPHS